MQQLDEYIHSNGKRLRLGYTTGTCAAAATRAACELLLRKAFVPAVDVETPAGLNIHIDIEEHRYGDGWAQCAVYKDAGDDPDVTDGVEVLAKVSLREESGIRIEGGTGIGRVTQAGLDQPVGAAAINSVPRAMIAEQAQLCAQKANYKGGLEVEISIPAGTDLAAHTFNPRLGIEGGISVLGTTGIVKPMSEDALIASIELELKVLRERGANLVLVSPGNYGCNFARDTMKLSLEQAVQCSNYIGSTIDSAALLGFSRMLIVGHIGKMAKVAGGIMNTHSRVADCRLEVMAAHAARAGAPQACIAHIMDAATTDAAIDILYKHGLLETTMKSIVGKIEEHVRHRTQGRMHIEAVVFSNVYGLLGKTRGADALIELVPKVN